MVDVTPVLLEQSPTLAKAVAEVLEETVKRVEQDGFGQRDFWNPDTGKYCTRGHYTQVVLDKYLGMKIDGRDIWTMIIAACDMVMSMHLGQGVAVWNDKPGRTQEDVVTALTASASEARAWCVA